MNSNTYLSIVGLISVLVPFFSIFLPKYKPEISPSWLVIWIAPFGGTRLEKDFNLHYIPIPACLNSGAVNVQNVKNEYAALTLNSLGSLVWGWKLFFLQAETSNMPALVSLKIPTLENKRNITSKKAALTQQSSTADNADLSCTKNTRTSWYLPANWICSWLLMETQHTVLREAIYSTIQDTSWKLH